MAVTENYKSRRMHITSQGTSITQEFDCSNTDWNNWIALGGPVIGSRWSALRPDLRVTDIRNEWQSNTSCKAYVTYSTQGMIYPEQRPGKLASITELFDYQQGPAMDDVFVNTDGASKSWTTLWDTWKSGTPVPPRYPQESLVTVQRRMNLGNWNWPAVRSHLNTVNDDKWMVGVAGWISRTKPLENITCEVTEDDTGKWLLTGFHADKVGYVDNAFPNYELTFTFMYYHDGWNTPYEISPTIAAYRATDFETLPIPTDFDDTEIMALR